MVNSLLLSASQHIVSSADHDANPVSFAAAGANQLLLHELDKNIFPKPKHEVSAPLSGMPHTPKLPMAKLISIL
jgi:hypothetical protein